MKWWIVQRLFANGSWDDESVPLESSEEALEFARFMDPATTRIVKSKVVDLGFEDINE